ncbi:MAG: DUF1987 domain-containing protein [Crocinitomix sp.]|nr:DUF1987 domain-containing protein [Crocinitomix sp.]
MGKILSIGSAKLPIVDFDSDSGLLTISGRCIPENALGFFNPIKEWIEEYSRSPKSETTFDIFLEYFNTSSSKCLLDLFKQVEAIHLSGRCKMKIIWRYEEDDEDMLEAGYDYSHIVKIPFEMIEVKE